MAALLEQSQILTATHSKRVASENRLLSNTGGDQYLKRLENLFQLVAS